MPGLPVKPHLGSPKILLHTVIASDVYPPFGMKRTLTIIMTLPLHHPAHHVVAQAPAKAVKAPAKVTERADQNTDVVERPRGKRARPHRRVKIQKIALRKVAPLHLVPTMVEPEAHASVANRALNAKLRADPEVAAAHHQKTIGIGASADREARPTAVELKDLGEKVRIHLTLQAHPHQMKPRIPPHLIPKTVRTMTF